MSPRPQRRWLSADLPQTWLLDPSMLGLSDRAWRLHTCALMWATGRTNGVMPPSALPVLLPSCTDDERRATVDELVAARLWCPARDGWRIVDWAATQSTVEQIKRHRKLNRDRQARWREEHDAD